MKEKKSLKKPTLKLSTESSCGDISEANLDERVSEKVKVCCANANQSICSDRSSSVLPPQNSIKKLIEVIDKNNLSSSRRKTEESISWCRAEFFPSQNNSSNKLSSLLTPMGK